MYRRCSEGGRPGPLRGTTIDPRKRSLDPKGLPRSPTPTGDQHWQQHCLWQSQERAPWGEAVGGKEGCRLPTSGISQRQMCSPSQCGVCSALFSRLHQSPLCTGAEETRPVREGCCLAHHLWRHTSSSPVPPEAEEGARSLT